MQISWQRRRQLMHHPPAQRRLRLHQSRQLHRPARPQQPQLSGTRVWLQRELQHQGLLPPGPPQLPPLQERLAARVPLQRQRHQRCRSWTLAAERGTTRTSRPGCSCWNGRRKRRCSSRATQHGSTKVAASHARWGAPVDRMPMALFSSRSCPACAASCSFAVRHIKRSSCCGELTCEYVLTPTLCR